MLLYCLKYRKYTKSKNPKLNKKQENQCFYQNLQCECKNWMFINEQKAIGFLDDMRLVGKPSNF